MDISKEYIKMCKKAESIQKKRSFVKIKESGTHHLVDDVFLCERYEKEDENLVSYRTVWLPRQDQLQEMIIKNYNKVDILLNKFADFSDSYYQNTKDKFWIAALHFTSMEQLWLAFVMKEKYNKTWNGEKWIL